jgi:hypothetical protein
MGKGKQIATARSDRERELEEWEWTVSPEATLPPGLDLDRGDASGEVLDGILDALEADERAHGVGGCSFDRSDRWVGSIFQVHLDPAGEPTIADAVEAGRVILADALAKAGLDATVDRVSAVRGGEADDLPGFD